MTIDISEDQVGEDTALRSLEGKRVVVVGGTSGMGLGAVRAAVAAGAEVVVAGRRSEADRGFAPHDQISHAVVDVTDEGSVQRLFEQVGELDHLFVTAAPAPGSWGVFLEQDLAAGRQFLDAKFYGSWLSARYAAPRISERGSITFLTGATSIRPKPGLAIVTAAFAAVEAFSQGLAVDLAPVRVNTIRPGLIDSDMWTFLDDASRDELRAKVRAGFPVRRVGSVDDIGQAATFLMTNPYVTGAVLEVTGGEQFVNVV